MPDWPGTSVEDATTALERNSRAARPAVDAPDRYTLCDRCRKPLDAQIWALTHHQLGGTPGTWFVCLACHADFLAWFVFKDRAQPLGGT